MTGTLGLLIGCVDAGRDGDGGWDRPDSETSSDGEPIDPEWGDPPSDEGEPGDPPADEGPLDTDDGDGDGDGDGDPGQKDSDGDGTVNADDNCPATPNPNQLDFDDNGLGNVCDTLVFTDVSGDLSIRLNAETEIAGACELQIAWVVNGGTVRIQLDDDASVASLEISELRLADIAVPCELAITVDIELLDAVISNAAGPFPMVMPHSPVEHDNGTIDGDLVGPHAIELTGGMDLSANGEPTRSSNIQVAGALPLFDLSVSGGGATGTLTWTSMGTDVTELDSVELINPIPFTLDYKFWDLEGSLSLAP